MSDQTRAQPGWRRRLAFFLAFFVVESAVFAIITLSPYVSTGILLPAHAALTALLLVLALFLAQERMG